MLLDNDVHHGSEQPDVPTASSFIATNSAVGERMSAAEWVSEANSAEQVGEWAMRLNGWTDDRVAQYLHKNS